MSALEQMERLAHDFGTLKELEEETWRWRQWQEFVAGHPMAADGPFYTDAKQSAFGIAADAAVTLATTDKMIYPGVKTLINPANLFDGKMYEVYLYGTVTTAATPGNLGVEVYWGSTDAATTLLASSAAWALVANQTTIPFLITCRLRINSRGATGAAEAYAKLEIGTAVMTAATLGAGLIPASAPAPVTVDTTAATSGLGVQMKRSGSTAETVTTRIPVFNALN